jgi:hypothetical protein
MSALQSSMNSPASLRDASANDPKVKAFLDDVWESLGMDQTGTDGGQGSAEVVEEQPPSGLEAIQKVMGDMFSGREDKPFKANVEPSKDAKATTLNVERNAPSPPVDDSSTYASLSRIVSSNLEAEFKPEFLNRLDDIIVFKPLGFTELRAIAEILLGAVAEQAKREKNVTLEFSEDLVEAIVKEGSGSARKFGAR